MNKIVRHFDALNKQQIIDQPDGAFGDYELLDVLAHFDELQDEERSAATIELILRSPECSELVDYSELYYELVLIYQSLPDFKSALRWAYAWLAYSEQHEEGASRPKCSRALAGTYLDMGDLDTGLAIFARRLQTNPGDLHTYITLAAELPEVGLHDLALDAATRGLSMSNHPDFDDRRKILVALHRNASKGEKREGDQNTSPNAEVLSTLKDVFALASTDFIEEAHQEPYLPPLRDLLLAGTDLSPELTNEIIDRGKVLAPELMRVAFDLNLVDSHASEQAISLLRKISPFLETEFTLLTSWLARADGNWQAELLSSQMGKVGGYTSDELEAIARNGHYDEAIRSTALEALTERAQKLPDQRGRVISFFAEFLERPEAWEASEEGINGAIIMNILDLEARELYPQVKAAFDEDRVDPTSVTLFDVHFEWGLEPIEETPISDDLLRLDLRCTACGRTRPHTTRYILVDQSTLDSAEEEKSSGFDPCILDHEVICPKCGARDQYSLTTLSSLTVFPPRDPEALIALISGEQPKTSPKLYPHAYFMRSTAFGRPMHPLQALEEYRWRTTINPGDADLRLGYANVLRNLFRYDEALVQFRFALELAPKDPDVLISNAMAEHDLGDREVARRCYKRILELEPVAVSSSGPVLTSDYYLSATGGLMALDRSEPSEWQMMAYNADGEPPPPIQGAQSTKRPSEGKKRKHHRRKKK